MRHVRLVVAVFLAAACRGTTLDVPPPATTADDLPSPSPIALPSSYVSAPIVFDLRPRLADLEKAVPRRFGSIEKEARIKVNDDPAIWVAPELERGPLEFSFKANSVTVSTTFQYRTRAWTKVFLVENSVSCGLEGPRPRMRLRMTVTYDIAPDWTLRTTSRLDDLSPITEGERDQCEISLAKINVTGKVAEASRGALESALGKADRRMRRVSLETPIGRIWRTINRPISIAQGALWLQIQPQAISLGGITTDDSTLTVRIGMLASPRMVSGTRPPDADYPLPALGQGTGGSDTVLVYIEGVLGYTTATRILNQALVGKSFTVGWRRVKIEHITALPGGEGRVVLGVQLRGKARGMVYVTGTPTYDRATDLITLPDLNFDVNTTTALGPTLDWLIQGPLLGMMRDNAKIPADALLSQALALANQEINRTLSKGVFLRGALSGAETRAVSATRQGLVARAQARGRLWLEVSRLDILPGAGKAVN